MIKIGEPLCFSEIGMKDNQEDYLYPQKADSDNRVFILCDGMGGHDNGEVASMTAASTLGKSLSSHSRIDKPLFEKALSETYDALDAIDTMSDRKPGTTMTALCFNEDSYLVAHIGDSRIYHIRPSSFNEENGSGGILYQSSDHSLVNDLLKAGEITEEEARNFPRKNVITRAMQPHLPQRHRADIFIFDDIAAGDYFFLCSDGVFEQLSNKQLCRILSDKSLDNHQKLNKIKDVSQDKTRDNFSCWLIPVEKVEIGLGRKNNQVICATEEDNTVSPPAPKRSMEQPPVNKIVYPAGNARKAPAINRTSVSTSGAVIETVSGRPYAQPKRTPEYNPSLQRTIRKTTSRRKAEASKNSDDVVYVYSPAPIYIGIAVIIALAAILWLIFAFLV